MINSQQFSKKYQVTDSYSTILNQSENGLRASLNDHEQIISTIQRFYHHFYQHSYAKLS